MKIDNSAERAAALLNWYEKSVRTFLEKQVPEQVAPLDEEAARLKGVLTQANETMVCFVGDSGVGKSTLLNAIVAGDRTIAPAGGVGPLTALATELRYSATPRLKASYHPKKHLWRVAAALNFQVARQRKVTITEPLLATTADLTDEERKEIETEIEVALQPDNEGSTKGIDEFIRMARLMVCGNQDDKRPLEYVADALSMACAVKARWESTISDDDAVRIRRIAEALQMAAKGEFFEVAQESQAKTFRDLLKEHAAGFLSPLIQRIEVGWPSDALKKGLVLVDLPGVGVVGDVYKKETQQFVRDRARAVVMVVGRSGPTESVMNLLRTTRFWDRLLVSSDDPGADPFSLMIAVSHVDDVATQHWYDIDPDEEGKRPKSKAKVFGEVSRQIGVQMRTQFENQLADFVPTDGSDAIREGRESARRTLLEALKLFPVSAIEYRRLLANNDDDRPFLTSIEQSGVPAMAAHLAEIADAQTSRRDARLEQLIHRLASQLMHQVDSIEAVWRSDRAAEDAERVRSALNLILADKAKVFEERRTSFRVFLNQVVPERIKIAVLEAKEDAQKGVNKYLRALQGVHWATLRAAVQRGGTYIGARHIDLPTDIALRFQDPVAAAWSQSLLKAIRKETYSLASDARKMVEEICDWAVQEQGAFVDERVIDGQKRAVSAQAERLRDVGKEAVEDLRNVVMVQVVEAIEEPIRRACKKFVDENLHRGRGARDRMLELFEELAADSTRAAGVPTEATLQDHYKGVNREIKKAFKEWGDPLVSVADAIVERHEDRMKRSDSQRRSKVLEAVDKVRSSAPSLLATIPVEMSELRGSE
jgi:hypothetical protein